MLKREERRRRDRERLNVVDLLLSQERETFYRNISRAI